MTARRRLLLGAVVLGAVALVAGPLSAADAGPSKRETATPADPVHGSSVIASETPDASPVYDPEYLPPEQPGYYLVYTADGESIPVYWMPSGTAGDAPEEIQDIQAYRSAVKDPDLDQFDTLIYAKGVAVSLPADAATARKASAADCWGGWSCLYGQQTWSGAIVRLADDGYWQNLAAFNFNNQASSLFNNKDFKSTVYATDPDGGGNNSLCLYATSAVASLSSFWDDNISSVKIKQNNVC
jgi:hypothetical protein